MLTPRCSSAMLVATALLVGCSVGSRAGPRSVDRDRGESGFEETAPYVPRDAVQAPPTPPAAEILTDAGRADPVVVALDWRTAEGGPVLSPAAALNWPQPVTTHSWALEIASATRPFRVVMYRYVSVGPTGIPEEAAGDEIVCSAVHADCSVSVGSAPGRFEVRRQIGPRDGYFVVQATWLNSRVVDLGGPSAIGVPDEEDEASISWGFRVTSL